MAETNSTDPPSAEQKRATIPKRVRRIFRRLVSRQTLLVALRILFWIVSAVRAYRRMKGDF